MPSQRQTANPGKHRQKSVPRLRYGTPLSIHGVSPDPIGGASQARIAVAGNGSRYIIKGPSLIPGHPLVAANELIAAQLADELGLPILGHRVLSAGTDLFFASDEMPKGSFDAVTEELFNRCVNRDLVYQLVVFDAWLWNNDRHQGNLLVRRPPDMGPGSDHFLLPNDHSHCLVKANEAVDVLESRVDTPVNSPDADFFRVPAVRAAVEDQGMLVAAIDRVESLPPEVVETIVQAVPDGLISSQERRPIVEFLLARQKKLRDLFAASESVFPNLRRTTP